MQVYKLQMRMIVVRQGQQVVGSGVKLNSVLIGVNGMVIFMQVMVMLVSIRVVFVWFCMNGILVVWMIWMMSVCVSSDLINYLDWNSVGLVYV